MFKPMTIWEEEEQIQAMKRFLIRLAAMDSDQYPGISHIIEEAKDILVWKDQP